MMAKDELPGQKDKGKNGGIGDKILDKLLDKALEKAEEQMGPGGTPIPAPRPDPADRKLKCESTYEETLEATGKHVETFWWHVYEQELKNYQEEMDEAALSDAMKKMKERIDDLIHRTKCDKQCEGHPNGKCTFFYEPLDDPVVEWDRPTKNPEHGVTEGAWTTDVTTRVTVTLKIRYGCKCRH